MSLAGSADGFYSDRTALPLAGVDPLSRGALKLPASLPTRDEPGRLTCDLADATRVGDAAVAEITAQPDYERGLLMKPEFRCPQAHTHWRPWIDAIRRWPKRVVCPRCGGPVRWFGAWPPAKAAPEARPRPYEVLFVAFYDWLDKKDSRYLAALILCRNLEQPSEYVLWPRYWVRPAGRIQFGQDGPLLTIEKWDELRQEVRGFLSSYRPDCSPGAEGL